MTRTSTQALAAARPVIQGLTVLNLLYAIGLALLLGASFLMVLDIEDVLGKRILTPRLGRSVTIREENARAALEVMSRFAVDPRWLIYLPPTMAPPATAVDGDLLERPKEAFDYFRTEGVLQLVCEEKHMARLLRGGFDRCASAEHDEVGERDRLAAGLLRIERIADAFQRREDLRELGGLVDRPVLLRSEPDARAVGAAALVAAAERRRRRPRRRHQLRDRQTRSEQRGLERGDVVRVDELVVQRRNRVLPDQRLLRHERTEIARDRPHALEQRLAGYAAATPEAPQRGVGRISGEALANVRVQGRQLNALLSESSAELADTRHVRVLAYHFDTPTPR